MKLEKNILAGCVGEYVFVEFQLVRLLCLCFKPGYKVCHVWHKYAVHVIQLVTELCRAKLVNVIPRTQIPVV